MYISKEWDWSKNEDKGWMIPCVECAYLAERWKEKRFDNFLDLGCGLGRHSFYMAQKDFKVSAVDLSKYSVEHVEKWAEEKGLNVDVRNCNMFELPFEENSMDCIIAYNVIYHTDTEGFKEVLRQIERVLKPGGEIFLTLLSKSAWNFENKDKYKKIDENSLILDDYETEMNVPHFFMGKDDLADFFKNWEFFEKPLEYCEYLENGRNNKHWKLMMKLK